MTWDFMAENPQDSFWKTAPEHIQQRALNISASHAFDEERTPQKILGEAALRVINKEHSFSIREEFEPREKRKWKFNGGVQ